MKTNWPALRHGCLILASMSLAASAALAQTQEPVGSKARAAVISTTLTLQRNEKTRPEFHYNEAAPNLVTARSTKGLRISALRFALPGELTQPSVALASFSGTKEPVRPDSTTQAAQQAVQQANTAATPATSAPAQAPAAAAPAPPQGAAKYTGEPISVKLKEVDLRDFLRLIHEIH